MNNITLKNDCKFGKYVLKYSHYNNEVKYGS